MNDTAVMRAGGAAGLAFALEHTYAGAAFRQCQRRGEARHAAADNRDVYAKHPHHYTLGWLRPKVGGEYHRTFDCSVARSPSTVRPAENVAPRRRDAGLRQPTVHRRPRSRGSRARAVRDARLP